MQYGRQLEMYCKDNTITKQKLMETIDRHKNGDRAATEKLLEMFEPLIRAYCKKFKHINSELEYEDYLQEARLACLKACERWEGSHTSSPTTYISTCIIGKIKQLNRTQVNELTYSAHAIEIFWKINKILNQEPNLSNEELRERIRKLNPTHHPVSLAVIQSIRENPPDQNMISLEEAQNTAGYIPDEFDYIDLKVSIDTILTERERQFVHLLAEGLSMQEIAKKMKLKESTLNQMLSRIRIKARAKLWALPL